MNATILNLIIAMCATPDYPTQLSCQKRLLRCYTDRVENTKQERYTWGDPNILSDCVLQKKDGNTGFIPQPNTYDSRAGKQK
jgi:hypothetical protein